MERLISLLGQAKIAGSHQALRELIVNPFLPILLCDYHYGVTEVPRGVPFLLRPLDISHGQTIQNFDVVCCQTDAFKPFVEELLPLLQKKIILFTHKWQLPFIKKSKLTETVKNHDMVAHWFMTNPVYENDDTFSAFPYGIREKDLVSYARALLEFNGSKDIAVNHLHVRQTNFARNSLPVKPAIVLKDFYREISRSRYLLSPQGDKPDCYRHWEAIGLGTVPIQMHTNKTICPIKILHISKGENPMETLCKFQALACRSSGVDELAG